MNGRILLIGTLVYFILAYFLYGKFLSKRFGIDKKKPCPSHTQQDGIDYIPTNPAVLFGHHFASIAGAGPIIGPIVAAAYGWLPALLWIIIGCVFIGAMHDFAAMFLSIRNQGRSIAYAIEKELGYVGRQIFLLFCVASLLLVVAIFTMNIADGFLANPSIATSSILFILMAPFFGILTNRKILTIGEASLIFVPILFVFVWFGTLIPFDMEVIVGDKAIARNIWTAVLLYYAAVASIIPVWILLQPRDYLNSYLLYAMMAIGIISIVCASPSLQMNAVAVHSAKDLSPNIFPLLFVTIACGACSGFHALVSSGTSAKQIDKESHILPVAYGGMLLEGVLAVISIISIAYLKQGSAMELLSGSNKVPPPIILARGLASFSEKIGINYKLCYNFVSLAISAFLLTSLDTATRLARFLLQELFMPSVNAKKLVIATGPKNVELELEKEKKSFRFFVSHNNFASTVVIIALSAILAFSGEGNEIWPIFGASNQLLAALTLLCVTLWLSRKHFPKLFAMLPMFFMLIISVWALVCLIIQKWGNWTLVILSFILIALALVLVKMAFTSLFKPAKHLEK